MTVVSRARSRFPRPGGETNGAAHELSRSNTARSRSAFHADSAYSSSAVDWTVIPPPVPSVQRPSPPVIRLRMTTPRSARPSAAIQPKAPAYAERGDDSTSSITSIVRSLGAPVIEPAGNSACSASRVVTSGRSRPRTVLTSWWTFS